MADRTTGAPSNFETNGRHVLAYHERLRPDQLAPLLDVGGCIVGMSGVQLGLGSRIVAPAEHDAEVQGAISGCCPMRSALRGCQGRFSVTVLGPGGVRRVR